jgi:hypothetical protein
MSICVPIRRLTDEQRLQVLQHLAFKVENPRFHTCILVHPYRIHDDNLYMPYAWAIDRGFPAPKRTAFPACAPIFAGNLRPYQRQVKRNAIDLLQRGTCILALHVGWGKSVFAIYLACKMRMRTVVVVPTLALLRQWVVSIQQVCPSSTCHILTTKTRNNIPVSDFYVVNAQNLPKFAPSFLATLGVVVVDELHLVCTAKLQQALLHLTPRYLIGLSATPYRMDDMTRLVELNYGTERIEALLQRPHTVYGIQTGIALDVTCNADGSLNWGSLLESQATHTARNQLIVELVTAFPTHTFLVLVKRLEQGHWLHDAFTTRGERCTHLLGMTSTFDVDARILIATASKVGTGFSHNTLNALVLAADMRDFFIQRLGRVFRTQTVEPIVFDLVDTHPILQQHYKTRVQTYKQIGGVVRHVRNASEWLLKCDRV